MLSQLKSADKTTSDETMPNDKRCQWIPKFIKTIDYGLPLTQEYYKIVVHTKIGLIWYMRDTAQLGILLHLF